MNHQLFDKLLLERKILLNPGPSTTSMNVKLAQLVPDICPREMEFGEVLQSICKGLLKLAKAEDTHHVALLGSSGTGAMEAVLSSAISATSKILILTNGAYGIRFAQIATRLGIQYDTLLNFGEYPELDQLKEQLESEVYSHVVMVHHETSSGMLNPLEAISKLCSERNVRLIVDAMSSFGAYPLNLSSCKIDYLISSSNKCLQGMAGLSFVIFHQDCIQELKTNARNYYFDLYAQWNSLEVKKQLRFTPPVQVCYALKKAIEETLIETIDGRWKRYVKNWELLYQGMLALGFTSYVKLEQQSKILMALHMNQEFDFKKFHDHMFERGITIYPGVIPETNTFRLAVIGDLYEEDIKLVLKEMEYYFE